MSTPKSAPLPLSPQLSNNQWLPTVGHLCSSPRRATGDFLYPDPTCPYTPVSQPYGPPIILYLSRFWRCGVLSPRSLLSCLLPYSDTGHLFQTAAGAPIHQGGQGGSLKVLANQGEDRGVSKHTPSVQRRKGMGVLGPATQRESTQKGKQQTPSFCCHSSNQ